MNSADAIDRSTVTGSTRPSQVVNRNSWSTSSRSMNWTASRLCAPPSGVPAPPTLVPHAMAMSSAEPNALLPTSSMPTKRSMASTIGIIAAATTAFGSTELRIAAITNQTTRCWRVPVPRPSSDTSAMRRSSPQRFHSVASMLAPRMRMTSCSE